MTAYGFVIDQRKCIGCHACTVVCKSENDVPVGSFRTWVKYVEVGEFPDSRRHFSVMRCNHCDDAPCMKICPVHALSKREDGIVDLDREACIGCASCLQACPYDALYLNPDSGVAEKCHFCAHRVEVGLQPACAVICPEQAILAGDLDDPHSAISKTVLDLPVQRRREEKGTGPRVWYVDALEASLDPGATSQPDSWIWSDRRFPAPEIPDGLPQFEPGEPKTVLDTDRGPAWGWHVWGYLFTKNLAAGAMMVAPLLGLIGLSAGVWHEWIALLALALTGALLVADLGKPERALSLLTRGNLESWLVRGAWILTAFGVLISASLASHCLGEMGWVSILRWASLPVAVLASGYSAFLFGQCRGRDLWLEKGLFPALVARAALLGLLLAFALVGPNSSVLAGQSLALLGILNLVLLNHEVRGKTKTAAADRARRRLVSRQGPLVFVIGLILATGLGCLVAMGSELEAHVFPVIAVVAALSMLPFEKSWVFAGQEEPNS